MNRQFLQSQIAGIESQRYGLEWLNPYLRNAEKIANFGCNIGTETLALMWHLKAQEAVGLDKNMDSIRQAQDTLHHFRQDIEGTKQAIQNNWVGVSDQDRTWWSGLPEFFTQRILEQDFSLQYFTNDITQPTGLQNNCYELAFCDYVLHHIWYDETQENAEPDVQFAVKEMARVVKPGGTVAARELIRFDDKPRLDFARLFENAGLEELHVDEEEFVDLRRWVGKYVYRKS